MDLVAGVRKEGSRGGRDAFKWEDVKDDQHRENYLGHSLMAPVGRWQRNKDLSWYAKGDDSQNATDAAKARAEEIRRIKEAEQDALSEALGFKVEPRLRDSQLAGPKEVEKAIRETADDEDEVGKGIGFGGFLGGAMGGEDVGEMLMGYEGERGGLEGGEAKKEKRERRRRRSRSHDRITSSRRKRSRSRDRHREKESRHKRHDDGEGKSHNRHRERSTERHNTYRSRSRSRERRRHDNRHHSRQIDRSRSPYSRRRERTPDRERYARR